MENYDIRNVKKTVNIDEKLLLLPILVTPSKHQFINDDNHFIHVVYSAFPNKEGGIRRLCLGELILNKKGGLIGLAYMN